MLINCYLFSGETAWQSVFQALSWFCCWRKEKKRVRVLLARFSPFVFQMSALFLWLQALGSREQWRRLRWKDWHTSNRRWGLFQKDSLCEQRNHLSAPVERERKKQNTVCKWLKTQIKMWYDMKCDIIINTCSLDNESRTSAKRKQAADYLQYCMLA